MEEKVTLHQAYQIMYIFIKNYYYRTGKPSDIGRLLGDIQRLHDGQPADPASWKDWLDANLEAKKNAKSNNDETGVICLE